MIEAQRLRAAMGSRSPSLASVVTRANMFPGARRISGHSDNNGRGSCKNPKRPYPSADSPADFFAPCHRIGGAYTYANDNNANTLNGDRCRDAVGATCCIGNGCLSWDDMPR
ncbi:hypothetical protein IF2G_10956 [Cordyceps javanica]|nr:hypothetical protein IF2G_10956 [Cordyceps javanica]